MSLDEQLGQRVGLGPTQRWQVHPLQSKKSRCKVGTIASVQLNIWFACSPNISNPGRCSQFYVVLNVYSCYYGARTVGLQFRKASGILKSATPPTISLPIPFLPRHPSLQPSPPNTPSHLPQFPLLLLSILLESLHYPSAPVNKLVSLTWLLWALRSFRSFTLHYITSLPHPYFLLLHPHCVIIHQMAFLLPCGVQGHTVEACRGHKPSHVGPTILCYYLRTYSKQKTRHQHLL